MSLRAQVLSGFRWTASVRLLSQAITWAMTLLVVRLLTPADYGLLAMATVFVAFLTMFSEFGLGPAVVQRRDIGLPLLKRVFATILVVHTALTLLLVLAAPYIAQFYGEPRVAAVVRVLSLQFVISAFGVIPDAMLQRRMEFRNRSLLDFSGTMVNGVTTLALAASGAGVWALVIGSLAGQIWRIVGVNWLSPFLHLPHFSLEDMRPLLTFGTHVTTAGVFGMIFAQADTVICAKMLGNQLLGFYSVGVNLASLPSQKTAALVNSLAFPAFASMQHDVGKVRENVLLGVRFLSFFSFPVTWGMSSIAPEIVEVVLGAKWRLATIPLQALSIVIPFRMIGNFVAIVLQSQGRADVILRNTTWGCAVGIPFLFMGAYFGGLTGLSLAWIAALPLLFVPALMRAAPILLLPVTEVLSAIAPWLGGTIVMYLVVTAAREIVTGYPGWARLAILIIIGAITYAAISVLVLRTRSLEIFSLVRSILTERRGR